MADVRIVTPRTQVVWLSIYWAAAVINAGLMIQGLASIGEIPLPGIVAVVLAFISTLIGALFATRIMRRRVESTVFIRGTTTVRVIAIAWIVIEFAIVSTAVLSVVTGLELSELDWSPGFAGTVGSVSLLAVLGPGYSEYREATHPHTA
jgi:hypothetical protein